MANPVAPFVREPYVRPAYTPDTRSLLQLLQLAGAARTQGLLEQGQRTAQGRMNLGAIIGDALGQFRQGREQKELLAARNAFEQMKIDRAEKLDRDQMAEAKATREAQTQWQRDQFRVGTADAAADVMVPGQTVSPEAFSQRFAGTPSEVRFQHDPAMAARLPAVPMADAGGVPGYATPQTDQQPFDVMQRASMSPDVAARPEQYRRAPTFTETMTADTAQRQREAAAAAAQNTIADNTRADAAAKATEAYRASQLKLGQQRVAASASRAAAAASDVTALSPAGVDAAALNYAKTGTLPPLGMGDKSTRKQIINRAAEMMPGLDIASAKADFTANQGSLVALQKQRDALGAFEATALKNLDQFLEIAKKVPDTGSPWLNRPLRSINEKALGGETLAAYNTARRTVIPEFAKILANPGLSGQLSDTARKEIEDVVSENATLKQTMAAAAVLKQDTENRRTSYDDQIKGIRERISKASGPSVPPPPIVPTTTGMIEAVDPQGNIHHAPAGTPLPAGWKPK